MRLRQLFVRFLAKSQHFYAIAPTFHWRHESLLLPQNHYSSAKSVKKLTVLALL